MREGITTPTQHPTSFFGLALGGSRRSSKGNKQQNEQETQQGRQAREKGEQARQQASKRRTTPSKHEQGQAADTTQQEPTPAGEQQPAAQASGRADERTTERASGRVRSGQASRSRAGENGHGRASSGIERAIWYRGTIDSGPGLWYTCCRWAAGPPIPYQSRSQQPPRSGRAGERGGTGTGSEKPEQQAEAAEPEATPSSHPDEAYRAGTRARADIAQANRQRNGQESLDGLLPGWEQARQTDEPTASRKRNTDTNGCPPHKRAAGKPEAESRTAG